ncbi:MAG: sugar transferase [Acidimicrobiia bacterium]
MRKPVKGSPALRRILIGLDAAGAVLAWALALTVGDGLDGPGLSRLPNTAGAVALAGVLSVAIIASQRLYLARECTVRAHESLRLGRAAVLGALLLQAGERQLGVQISLAESLGAIAAAFTAQRLFRDGYRSWLATHRRNGRHSRAILLVGANDEGAELYQLIADHPELGYRVCGVAGNPEEVLAAGFDVPFLGELRGPKAGSRLVAAALELEANGVVVAASAMSSADLNRIVRDLLGAGLHVHLSTGIRGIDSRRVRSQPIAHEPLFYLEPGSLSGWQLRVKRALDVIGAGIGLLLAAPVLVLCALAVKCYDRGPIFFRQERVGRDGKAFTILKFRTMVTDAEARLVELLESNEREGALFKLTHDPRITPIGRLLRASSLDELPQLINVLRGEMSLVGPRPALPAEVAQFDEELLARQRVLPGITGLWQVEARDNVSFRTYQRLDLFYVENWSVGLDIAILAATLQAVAGRCVRILRPRRAEGAFGLN